MIMRPRFPDACSPLAISALRPRNIALEGFDAIDMPGASAAIGVDKRARNTLRCHGRPACILVASGAVRAIAFLAIFAWSTAFVYRATSLSVVCPLIAAISLAEH